MNVMKKSTIKQMVKEELKKVRKPKKLSLRQFIREEIKKLIETR